jgi:hypothetical protein
MIRRTRVRPPRRAGWAVLLLSGVALAATPAVATSASHGAATCPFPHAKVVRSSSLARVFRAGDFLAGCARDHEVKTLAHDGFLEDGMGSEDYAHVRVAGSWVAHEDTGYFNPITQSNVVVQDLRRTGKRIATGTIAYHGGYRLAAPARTVHLPSNVRVTDLELRDTGTAAWIQSDPASGQFAVRVRGAGATTDLASGADIGPASLHLKGNRLSWTAAGSEHTARVS